VNLRIPLGRTRHVNIGWHWGLYIEAVRLLPWKDWQDVPFTMRDGWLLICRPFPSMWSVGYELWECERWCAGPLEVQHSQDRATEDNS
jgi:hypothetical protein